MRTRAERRTNNERVKSNFLRSLKEWTYCGMDEDWRLWYGTTNYNNRKPCSCWMCRNPRKTFKGNEKITIQERKFNAGLSSGSSFVS